MTPESEAVVIEVLLEISETMKQLSASVDALKLRLGDIDDELNAYSPTSCFDEIGD